MNGHIQLNLPLEELEDMNILMEPYLNYLWMILSMPNGRQKYMIVMS